ncbi:hypothetical protein COLU111180_03460 [Cohnella lubricantis]
MKKSLSLLLAIVMVFGVFASMASAATPSTPADAGTYLKDLGIVKGDQNGDLMADANWKRQDVAVLLSRLFGKEAAAQAHAKTHTFADVPAGYYDGFLSWAQEEKLIEGNSPTSFGWGTNITNQQFAAVVLRALGVDTLGDNYANVPTLAVEKGLLPEGTDFSAAATRGSTYSVIVTALNTVVEGQGKKLGTVLGLEGFDALELTAAKAINSKAVELSFTQDVAEIDAADVIVSLKDDEYTIKAVESVSVNKNVATVKLADALSEEEAYTVTVNGVASAVDAAIILDKASADFTYTAVAPASIGFAATTVAEGNDVEVVIKDAAGNDITPDFDLAVALEVASSNEAVVNTSLEAIDDGIPNDAAEYSVVNVTLTYDDDKTMETGNTIITVVDSLLKPVEISNISLDASEAVSTLYVGDNIPLTVEAKDQNGDVLGVTWSYRSQNPAVASVDSFTGNVTGIAAGTATIIVTAEFNDVKISKPFTVTVKKTAELTSLKIDKTSVKQVLNSGITEVVKVTALDQYGETYTGTGLNEDALDALTVTINKSGTPFSVSAGAFVDGVAEVTFAPVSGTDTAGATVSVATGGKKASIAASAVKAGAFAGYIVEPTSVTLDIYGDIAAADKKLGETNVDVKVYAKDTAGNKIYEVGTSASAQTNSVASITYNGTDSTSLVYSGLNIGTLAGTTKTGTQNVDVFVDSAKIATIAVKVVDSESNLTKYVQKKSSLSVTIGTDLNEALFGTAAGGWKDGAIVGYDQYGVAKQIAAADALASSNTSIVTQSNSNPTAIDDGTATLTIVLDSNVFVVTVNVK